MSLLLALTLRGSLAFLLVEGADRLAARLAPGQGHLGRRLAWLLAALVFLVPVHAARLSLPAWLLAAWAAGALAVLGVAAAQTVAAQRRWSRVRLSTDSRLLVLLEDAKAESGVTAPIGLVVSASVPAPALLGWLRPRILLPTGVADALPPERLRAILLHELAHFAALDVPANLLFTLVRAVHWFNPLAWLAARSWARFREEAADAAALRRIDGALYGETLLETLRHASAPVPYGAVGMGESLRNLKWRLTMIGRTRTPAARPAWALLLPALALAAAALPLPAQTSLEQASLRFQADPSLCVGFRDSLGYAVPAGKAAPQFKIEPGLSDPKGVSFESVDHPGQFLRHQNGRMKLQPRPAHDDLFAADATFFREPRADGEPGFLLRASNASWLYLSITRDNALCVSPNPRYADSALVLAGPDEAPASAPDAGGPEKEAALAAMRPWLELHDAGNYGIGWDQASPEFRRAETRADWVATVGRVRPPLGKCLERKVASANLQTDPSYNGKIDKGVFVTAQFDSAFENMKYATETACFRRAADGTWHAEGYFIKPRD